MNAARTVFASANRPITRALTCVFALVVALLAAHLFLAPSQALARSYQMTEAQIYGDVQTNGDIEVTEYRTFDFDGSYSRVHWDIPLANASDIAVLGAGEYNASSDASNAYTHYQESDSGAAGTYSIERTDDQAVISVYFSKEDAQTTFWISYTVAGGVKAWSDTGDVTWQAVGPGWGEATQNVSVWLSLPVPAGQTIELGSNVRAWADGPLDGVIGVDDDGDITFACPWVNAGQYLSVMVAFPVEWLSDATPSSESHLDAMMSMGAEIADSANEQRERARLFTGGATVLGALLGAGAIAFLLVKFFKHGREYKATFDDTYWRDLPSNDHPAVIGQLWRNGQTKNEDLTASLMRLTQMGAVKLDRVTTNTQGFLGRVKVSEDFRLTPVAGFDERKLDNIDRAAFALVFETVQKEAVVSDYDDETDGRPADEESSGAGTSVLFSELSARAKADPYGYRSRYDAWEEAVSTAASTHTIREASGEVWRGRASGIAIALAVLGVAAFFFSDDVGFAASGILIASAIICFLIGTQMSRRSQEVVEIVAKTNALRKWLCDFTNLKEAIPTDVVLWGKMLVLSVVLGVSDRVIEQLKLAVPQVFQDQAIEPLYLWYMPYGSMTAASMFHDAATEARTLSNSEIAQTESSSADGSGGGFGGGGFGSSFGGSSFGGGGGGAD